MNEDTFEQAKSDRLKIIQNNYFKQRSQVSFETMIYIFHLTRRRIIIFYCLSFADR